MTDITVHDPASTGETLTALVYRVDTGATVNGEGDACTETPSDSGRFVFDLTESLPADCRVDLEDAAGVVYYGWLSIGETIVVDTYDLYGSTAIRTGVEYIHTQNASDETAKTANVTITEA